MDPDACLEEILRFARIIAGCHDCPEGLDRCPESGAELAERAIAMDNWLRKGGFLPKAWERKDGEK